MHATLILAPFPIKSLHATFALFFRLATRTIFLAFFTVSARIQKVSVLTRKALAVAKTALSGTTT